MISVILILLFLLVVNILPNALNIIVFSSLIVAISFKYKKFFSKAIIFYLLFFVLGILAFVFRDTGYFDYLSKGIIGYGFMMVVMFTGVLPNRWDITRTLKKHRGTLSILTFITISPHALMHVFGVLDKVDLFGIASYVVMIPLTFISFKIIKKEIEPKDWLNIQKAAYVIYLLLFVHLIIVADWENKIVYAVLLTLYINNKLYKEYKK